MNGPSKEIVSNELNWWRCDPRVTSYNGNSTDACLTIPTERLKNYRNGTSRNALAVAFPLCSFTEINATAPSRVPIVPVLICAAITMLAWSGITLPARADQHTLVWDYDAADLARGFTNDAARVWFRLYYSPDATSPLTNWIVLPVTTNTTVKVDVPRAWAFFALSASNYLGTAWCANMTNVPAPVNSNYTIRVIKP